MGVKYQTGHFGDLECVEIIHCLHSKTEQNVAIDGKRAGSMRLKVLSEVLEMLPLRHVPGSLRILDLGIT